MELIAVLLLLPFISGLLLFAVPKRAGLLKEIIFPAAAGINLVIAAVLFAQNREISLVLPWAGNGFEFSVRLYGFNAFILLAAGGFGFFISLFTVSKMRKSETAKWFYGLFLVSLGLVNGALLADSLIVLLFFWEGLLGTTYGMIALAGGAARKTATKAFIIIGVSDLCMMAGIALYGFLAGTLSLSKVTLPAEGLAVASFLLLATGAVSKAGSLPFHSWIPDAAIDAPMPFMAILPASLEKLLGIYFLSRITLDMFRLLPGSGLSLTLMILGAVTILLAVMMALVQKDYKRLLSYHAISQVGYMILGIGTCVPVGVIGGIFHMVNHALYKSGLFLTSGAVEHRAGTTALDKLGGLGRVMPVTFACFLVTAASISGVPPFNGFFSKELIYDGALEAGWIFYAAAAMGSFFTAASFLKLGHTVFLGKPRREITGVKEAPAAMLVPLVVIALFCVFFGVANPIPLDGILGPALGGHFAEARAFGGFPPNAFLVAATFGILALAFLNHLFGFLRTKDALKAVDHIHHAPLLRRVYDAAERRRFDPYDLSRAPVKFFAKLLFATDRAVDFLYEKVGAPASMAVSTLVNRVHNGSYLMYLLWALAGVCILVVLTVTGVL
jgi:formate hydrogenlyase subunit 3/multisubunit Na+/H+ antiporter MnhD subunit